MYESGSWKHGTGVAGFSDVDYFISLKSSKPIYGSSALAAVKAVMEERFTNTKIRISSPAVVLEFGSGYEQVELIPAYPSLALDNNDLRYDIPGVRGTWLESTPEAHLRYVSYCNKIKGIEGGAKKLARLAKTWKYHNKVPVSSFYLEMRAAKYITSQKSVILPIDLLIFLKRLQADNLAAMNDPTGSTGRIYPCSSDSTFDESLSKLNTAVIRAQKAVDANKEGKVTDAFQYWDLFFNYSFPANV